MSAVQLQAHVAACRALCGVMHSSCLTRFGPAFCVLGQPWQECKGCSPPPSWCHCSVCTAAVKGVWGMISFLGSCHCTTSLLLPESARPCHSASDGSCCLSRAAEALGGPAAAAGWGRAGTLGGGGGGTVGERNGSSRVNGDAREACPAPCSMVDGRRRRLKAGCAGGGRLTCCLGTWPVGRSVLAAGCSAAGPCCGLKLSMGLCQPCPWPLRESACAASCSALTCGLRLR